MKTQPNLLWLLLILFLGSCASGYHQINPDGLNYQSISSDKSVRLDYRANVLAGKYAKRENKSTLRLLSLKISNNSGRDLRFGSDIKLIYGDGSDVTTVNSTQVYDATKQHTAIYLLYLLLTPLKFSTTSNNQETSSVPVGFVVGPGITATNMIIAGSANSKFKTELTKYDIENAVIKTGTTAYGLVGINSTHVEGIKIKVN